MFSLSVGRLKVEMESLGEKIGLSVGEVGWLLQKTESRVRGMLKRGELSYAVTGKLIDPVGVDDLIESEFTRKLLQWLLAGLLVAPKPERRHGPPAALLDGLRPLMLASPALVRGAHTGEASFVRRLADRLAQDTTGEGTEGSLIPVLSFLM